MTSLFPSWCLNSYRNSFLSSARLCLSKGQPRPSRMEFCLITRFAKWMVLCCGILRFVKLPALVFFCLCAAMFAGAQCGISNLGGCPATATATPATGTAPLAVTLNTTPPFSEAPSPSTWLFSRWDFGDGQTAITTQATHTYTVPGTYIASAYYVSTYSMGLMTENGGEGGTDPTVLASATITVTAPIVITS